MRARARKYEYKVTVYETNSTQDAYGGFVSEQKIIGDVFTRIEQKKVQTSNSEGDVITSFDFDFIIRAQQDFDVSRVTSLEFEGVRYRVRGYRDKDTSRKELVLNCVSWL